MLEGMSLGQLLTPIAIMTAWSTVEFCARAAVVQMAMNRSLDASEKLSADSPGVAGRLLRAQKTPGRPEADTC